MIKQTENIEAMRVVAIRKQTLQDLIPIKSDSSPFHSTLQKFITLAKASRLCLEL